MHRKTVPAAPFFLISAPSALKSPVSSGGLRPPKYFLNLGKFPQFQSRRAGEQKKTIAELPETLVKNRESKWNTQ